jgi:uncharacterized protein with ParB-like and HNH nuclease domain
MSTTISGKDYLVGKLFTPEFVFTIPPYQRPYAWEVDQATELFDDLVRAVGDATEAKAPL